MDWHYAMDSDKDIEGSYGTTDSSSSEISVGSDDDIYSSDFIIHAKLSPIELVNDTLGNTFNVGNQSSKFNTQEIAIQMVPKNLLNDMEYYSTKIEYSNDWVLNYCLISISKYYNSFYTNFLKTVRLIYKPNLICFHSIF